MTDHPESPAPPITFCHTTQHFKDASDYTFEAHLRWSDGDRLGGVATPEHLLACGFVPQQQLTEALAKVSLLEVLRDKQGAQLNEMGRIIDERDTAKTQLTAANALASEQLERAEALVSDYNGLLATLQTTTEQLAAERAKREHLERAAGFLERKGARLVLFAPTGAHATEDVIESSYDLMPDDVIAAAEAEGLQPEATPAAPAEGGQRPRGCLKCGALDDQCELRGCLTMAEGAKAAEGSVAAWVKEANRLDAYAKRLEAERAALVEPDIEVVAARVHENWCCMKLAAGFTSRLSESGEELMRPYAMLSEPAKELDRGTVRAVLDAIRAQPSPTSEAKDSKTCRHQWRSPLSHTCIRCGFVDEGSEHMGAVEFPGGEPRLDGETGPKWEPE